MELTPLIKVKTFILESFYFFVLISFNSCSKEIPFPEYIGESPYVLISFVKCNEQIRGKFYRANDFNNKNNFNFAFYKATLSWDTVSVEIFSTTPDFEFGEIAKTDVTYTITIINNLDTISGTTIIPSFPTIIESEYTIGNLKNEYGDPVLETRVRIKSKAPSFHEIKYFYGDIYNLGNDYSEIDLFDLLPVTNKYINDEGYLDFNPFTLVFKSQQDSFVLIDLNFIATSVTYNGVKYLPHKGFVVVRSLSESYYKYVKTLIKHKYNQMSSQSSGSPEWDYYSIFKKGEPIEVYSNVRGGIGIVAGYSEKSERLTYVED